ncbi:MAG: hypothetical protein ABIZ04_16220 [Opitutus sp.]
MPITKVIHKSERIVPVRFARAPDANDPSIGSGPFGADSPELDDRGFLPLTTGGAVMPVGLDEALAITARPETRVRLIREDIEDAAVLFVTTETVGTVVVTVPDLGTALPNTREMMIKLRALASGTTHLQVRFGSVIGPIIHRMQVVVHPLIDVRMVGHAPTINGLPVIDPGSGDPFSAQTTRTDDSIRALVDTANAIYFPYGIRLVLDAVIDRAGVANLRNQGMVNPNSRTEFQTVTAINRVPNAANAYFVSQLADGTAAVPINTILGLATSARRNPRTFGLFIAENAESGQVLAHEMGHLLGIINDPTNEFLHVNTVFDPAFPGTGRVVRDEIFTRRRLLYAFTVLEPDTNPITHPYRDEVGYGDRVVGGMLTVKQLANDKTDQEVATVRKAAADLSRAPGP